MESSKLMDDRNKVLFSSLPFAMDTLETRLSQLEWYLTGESSTQSADSEQQSTFDRVSELQQRWQKLVTESRPLQTYLHHTGNNQSINSSTLIDPYAIEQLQTLAPLYRQLKSLQHLAEAPKSSHQEGLLSPEEKKLFRRVVEQHDQLMSRARVLHDRITDLLTTYLQWVVAVNELLLNEAANR
jgi:Mg2+ and Co2+ transporter CorA